MALTWDAASGTWADDASGQSWTPDQVAHGFGVGLNPAGEAAALAVNSPRVIPAVPDNPDNTTIATPNFAVGDPSQQVGSGTVSGHPAGNDLSVYRGTPAPANAAVNQQLAVDTGYTGAFGSGGFDAWIKQQSPDVQAKAAQDLIAAGQQNRIDFGVNPSGANSSLAVNPGYAIPNNIWDSYGASDPGIQAEAQKMVNLKDPRFPTVEDYYKWHYENFGAHEGRNLIDTSSLSPTAQSYVKQVQDYLAAQPAGDTTTLAPLTQFNPFAAGLTSADIEKMAADPTSLANRFSTTQTAFTNGGDPRFVTVDPNQAVRLVDSTTGKVVFSGTGPDAAAQAAQMGSQLSQDQGKKAAWTIDTQDPSTGNWNTVGNDQVDKSHSLLGTVADIALPIIGTLLAGPLGLAGALGTFGGAAAGAALGSGVSSIAQGTPLDQAALKALLAGGTAGLLSGVGGAAGSGAISGNTGVESLLGGAGSDAIGAGAGDAAANTLGQLVVTAAPQVAPSALNGALSSLVTPAVAQTLATLGGQAATSGASDPNAIPLGGITVSPTASSSGTIAPAIGTVLAGAGLTSLPSMAPSGPLVNNTPQIPTQPADQGGATTVSPVDVAVPGLLPPAVLPTPPVIVPPVSMTPSGPLVNNTPQIPTTGGTSTTPSVTDLLRLLSLGGGLASAAGSGANTSGALSVNPIFHASLPAPNGLAANLTPRDVSLTKDQWNHYAEHPEMSFFNNVPVRSSGIKDDTGWPVQSDLAVQPTSGGTTPAASTNTSWGVAANVDTNKQLAAATGYTGPFGGGAFETWIQAQPEATKVIARKVLTDANEANRIDFARGGMAVGGVSKPSQSFAVNGPGTGRSDSIKAHLSDGEYVMDAETVALLGDGSGKAGAKKLDQLRVNIRKDKGRDLAKGRFSVNAKSPERYLTGGVS